MVHISEAWQSTTEWMITYFIITAIAIGLVSLGTMKPIINFEYWSTGELSLPTGWAYAQSGTGGWIRKVTEEDNVRTGTSSVGIEGSSIGNTQLYYMIDRNKERQMRGKVIELAGWVKSKNKMPNKISISVTGSRPAYYQNSGDWERLVVSYMVPTHGNGLNIYCNVESGADIVAHFDGIRLRVQK